MNDEVEYLSFDELKEPVTKLLKWDQGYDWNESK